MAIQDELPLIGMLGLSAAGAVLARLCAVRLGRALPFGYLRAAVGIWLAEIRGGESPVVESASAARG